MLVYPVILLTPQCIYLSNHKLKFSFIRLIARKSVIISSEKSGLTLNNLSKNKKGAPLQCNGVYWSITHKIKYVGGIVASVPVGIDIEKILPKPRTLYSKIATLYEWNLGIGEQKKLFFRYWTAKEAVLKAECIGLVGLSNCYIEKVIDEVRMVVRYGPYLWNVEHFYFDNHVAAIAINNFDVQWSIFKIN